MPTAEAPSRPWVAGAIGLTLASTVGINQPVIESTPATTISCT